MAYGYYKTITIDKTKVVGSADIANYPLLVAGTDANLKVTGSGGHVTSSSGYDIIFTSDAEGATKLDHEIDYYLGTTGKHAFWVRIPTLHYNSNDVIYMWYGDAGVTTSQENKTAVWDTDYTDVWHFSDYTAGGSAASSTTNGTSLSTTGSGSGANTDASSWGKYYSSSDKNTYLKTAANYTLIASGSPGATFEVWFCGSTTTNGNNGLFSIGTVSGQSRPEAVMVGTGAYFNASNGNGSYINGTASGVDSSLSQLVGKNSGSSANLRVNKAAIGTVNNPVNFDVPGYRLNVGAYYGLGYCYQGYIEEFRISKLARTNGYADTEYNNYKLTSTFYALGTETPVGGEEPPATAVKDLLGGFGVIPFPR